MVRMVSTWKVSNFLAKLAVLSGIVSVQCVEIRRLVVPRWLQNGTQDSVVLDCEYVYNENDIRLVVKWFFEDKLEPVYQWIPELNSRYTSGVLKDRLDLEFAVNTADAYSRYRAIRIKSPTTELSGKYTCLVASLAGQDARDQVMTVYVPAKEFEVTYSRPSDGIVNVTCTAHNLFPVPVLKLFLLTSSSHQPQHLSDTSFAFAQKPSGAYDACAHRTFSASELGKNRETFECTLELPGTNYGMIKRIKYYPGGIQGLQHDAAHSLSSSSKNISSSWIQILATVALTHVLYVLESVTIF